MAVSQKKKIQGNAILSTNSNTYINPSSDTKLLSRFPYITRTNHYIQYKKDSPTVHDKITPNMSLDWEYCLLSEHKCIF